MYKNLLLLNQKLKKCTNGAKKNPAENVDSMHVCAEEHAVAHLSKILITDFRPHLILL
jgi:hypothetical protein